MGTPRGIRNNNPGNIRKSTTKWQGEIAGTDPAFERFSAPVWGIRALAVILLNYERQHGLHTIRDIVTRWAPPDENDTDAYVRFVSARSGIDPDTKIKVPDHLESLLPAFIAQENGQQPYATDLIAHACQLARESK